MLVVDDETERVLAAAAGDLLPAEGQVAMRGDEALLEDEEIVAAAADETVPAGTVGDEHVLAFSGDERIDPMRARFEEIRPDAAPEEGIAVAGCDQIVTAPAIDGDIAGSGEDHVVTAAAMDRVVVAEPDLRAIDRRREDEAVARSGMDDGLRAVEKPNGPRREHGLGEGGEDAMGGARRVEVVEEGNLIRREFGRV